MKEAKKYRTEWTIEPTSGWLRNLQSWTAIQWYRGTIDMDNVHYCGSVEEAEREIDDAIILEQEQIIEKLRNALLSSNVALKAARSTFETMGVDTDILPDQIEENELILKHIGV